MLQLGIYGLSEILREYKDYRYKFLENQKAFSNIIDL